MAESVSLMYAEPTLTTSGSTSLKGDVGSTDLTRFFYNAQQSIETNNELTWGTLKYSNLTWGENKPLLYSDVLPGYHYLWNLETDVFTVTDDNEVENEIAPINTIKDLQVSWGVLANVQFMKRAIRVDELFLNASRVDISLISQVSPLGSFMYNDYLEEGKQHGVFDRLSDYTVYRGTIVDSEQSALHGENVKETILIPKMAGMQISNDYPLDLVSGISDIHPKRHRIFKNGERFTFGQYVMIAWFAQNVLSANNKVLYEPWMLYATFQWYFTVVHTAPVNRKIFDLSPRWS